MNTNKIIRLNNLLKEEILKYKDLTTLEIMKKLNITVKAKNSNYVIFNKIIENSSKSNLLLDLINQCSCIIKTVNLEWDNRLKESMSLKVIKYNELYIELWEESSLRKYFNDNIFIFAVFKKNFKDVKIEDVKVWKMPIEILDSGIKDTWQATKELIKTGKIVNYIDSKGRYVTYFPTISESKYIHVRPHAQNRNDVLPLPVYDNVTRLDKFVKHSFWLNSNFVKKIVTEDK